MRISDDQIIDYKTASAAVGGCDLNDTLDVGFQNLLCIHDRFPITQ